MRLILIVSTCLVAGQKFNQNSAFIIESYEKKQQSLCYSSSSYRLSWLNPRIFATGSTWINFVLWVTWRLGVACLRMNTFTINEIYESYPPHNHGQHKFYKPRYYNLSYLQLNLNKFPNRFQYKIVIYRPCGNYMSAMGITNGLQEQFVETGVVSWNFQCAVFEQPEEFRLIGHGWVVPISEMSNGNSRSAACVRTTKRAGSRLFKDPRWTLLPAFDLCQFRASAADCGDLIEKALARSCKCGTGVAIVAKRGAGIYAKNYSKQYRGRRWDIAAFCTGFGC